MDDNPPSAADMTTEARIPEPVQGLYESTLQASIARRRMELQQCQDCRAFCYPPGPGCPECLSRNLRWTPLSGRATIVSWAVFHKQYIPAYPAPYNVLAVRLDEGPIMISNLTGPEPAGSWIGRAVRLVYVDMPGDVVLPRFTLADPA